MKKDGRVKQVEFSRILLKQEVKNFPTLHLISSDEDTEGETPPPVHR